MAGSGITTLSSQALTKLMELSPLEQQWVQQQFFSSLEEGERSEYLSLLGSVGSADEGETAAPADFARERLLEVPDLTAGEKVLLAALIVSELFEASAFHSRQLTEVLRQSSNPVKNITAAINGLIGKGEMEVADPSRAAKNSHKRYKLTSEGLIAANSVARAGNRDFNAG